ncbi:hypothetical protein BC829DRAFT_421386 [Chytridium lagenaria]|nr:hypothetical protein BC829DRAFT_421386 [Chytridium lagenaria]
MYPNKDDYIAQGASSSADYTNICQPQMQLFRIDIAAYCGNHSFGISELKRLNDYYIVGVGGSNLQTAAAQNDSLQLMMHENNAIQRTMVSNFTFLHKAQDKMKDSFEASLLSFKSILDAFDKTLTDIAKKLDSSFESGSEIPPRVRIAPVEHQTIPDNSWTSSHQRGEECVYSFMK